MKNPALQHDDRLIPYEIRHKRSVTRRIHLRTAADGSLLVIAPRRMSKRSIHKMLQDRVHKVVSFLVGAQTRLSETPQPAYVDGEEHLFLGENHPLELREPAGCKATVELVDGIIRISTRDRSPARIKRLLEDWYRTRAGDHFAVRMAVLAGRARWLDSETPPIRLRKMKRTWGSCSGKRVITLNTRLVKTPPVCIDYVIAHEICHLQEMNHGRAFYALQDELFPDWRAVRSRLRKKAHIYLVD